jgi:hypothetical protein
MSLLLHVASDHVGVAYQLDDDDFDDDDVSDDNDDYHIQ